MKILRNKTMPLLFLLALCLLLSACDLTKVSFEAQSQNELANHTEETTQPPMSTAPSDTAAAPETTAPLVTQEPTSDTQEQTTQPPQPFVPQVVGLDTALVKEIVDHLETRQSFYSPGDTSFAGKMDSVTKSGYQPLHVKFDSENYYYACAYLTPAHEDPLHGIGYENSCNCCAREYLWVRYDSPEQIAESYEGMPLIIVFQVNKPLFCSDIGLTDSVTDMAEHYLEYTPEFENGVNIAPAVNFEQSFIYVNYYKNRPIVYFTNERQWHSWYHMDCMEQDGKFYVSFYLGTKKDDGTYSSDLAYKFKEYYDEVMQYMIMDAYSEVDGYNRTLYYGLLAVEDISKIVCQ